MICFKQVRDLREEYELTQKMMADILEVDKSSYAAWERGRDLFPLKRLIQIKNYYHVSLDYITGLGNQRKYINQKEEINIEKFKIRMKTIRKENGYTQEKLANKLNTTHSALSAYENGRQMIPLILLIQLSKMFNVSIDWMLGMSEQKYIQKDLITN